jgi:hypothetical protein
MARSKQHLMLATKNVLLRIEEIVSASKGDIDHLLMQAPELEKLLTVHRAIELATGATPALAPLPLNMAAFLSSYNQHTHSVGAGDISGPPREPLTLASPA